jgi:NAD(P)-dependent dehydrogenase (short-subunit alcohol dehydrogenase family)
MASRVAIVTGATQAMGEAIARRLGVDGWRIVTVGRGRSRGEAVVSRLRDAGVDARFAPADLTTEPAIAAVVAETVEWFGRLDLVVNNAAALDADSAESPADKEPTEIFDLVLKVGLYAPFWFTKYAVPHMIRQGEGGGFVNISSYAGSLGLGGLPAYSASKGGLEALTRQVAAEYAYAGIRANAVVLGSIKVPRNVSIYDDQEWAERSRAGRMISRPGLPEDVAAMVAFLASPDADFVTGACVPVDGGLLAKAPSTKVVHQAES